MNDEQHFLANAYVDGEVTADERRLAEADPDVMSEVELLTALRARIGAVELPSAAARESAIAAAMAAFAPATVSHLDGVAARNAEVTSAVVFRRRTWSTRYLGIAAGLVAIGVLGTVVVSSLGAGGDDDDAASGVVADETAALSVEEPSSSRILESSEGAVDPAGDEAASDMAAEMAPVAPLAEPAQEASDADMSAADSSRPEIDPTRPLTTPDELGSYGTYLLELQQARQLPPTPNTRCPQVGVMGATQYVLDDLAVEVLVAVDDVARTTTAIDPDTCEALVVGPLF